MKTIKVRFPTDANGLTGRECPNDSCLQYFKIKFGTGLSGPNLPCHCPYCGHTASQNDFCSQDQRKLMTSEIKRQIIAPALNEMSQRLESHFRNSRSVRFKAHRIQTRPYGYMERELETEVTCDNCTLVYAVYGVFAFCPDCGHHNSIQMLANNIDIVNKMLDLTAGLDHELHQEQIKYALEGCVAAFDGFGRELCRVHSAKCHDPGKLDRLSFQNLDGARKKVLDLFGVDIAAALTTDEWTTAVRAFQKRHVLAHRMGVIDAEYVERSGDSQAIVGRKVQVSETEVRALCGIIVKLARFLVDSMAAATGKENEDAQ